VWGWGSLLLLEDSTLSARGQLDWTEFCRYSTRIGPIRAVSCLGGTIPMPMYMYQGAYTSESIAAQIKEPKDRIEVVKPVFDAIGAKILAAGYPFGEYDVVVVFDAPDDTAAAGLALGIAAGGAVRSAKTTRLLSGQEWIESLQKAQGVAPQYRPAR
jgi:uncharacterized protein with GYD domain